LHQLATLSDIAAKTTPKAKQAMPKDLAMQQYMAVADAQRDKMLAEAKAVEAIDPQRAQMMGQTAWQKWQQQYQPLVGANPQEAAIAETLARYQQGE
jgi:hypothetical protein